MPKSFSKTVTQSLDNLNVSYRCLSAGSQDVMFLAPDYDEEEIWMTVKFNGIDSVICIDDDNLSTVEIRTWKKYPYDEEQYSDILELLNTENREDPFGAYCLDEETGFVELIYSLPHEVMNLMDFDDLIPELAFRYADILRLLKDKLIEDSDESGKKEIKEHGAPASTRLPED